MSIAFSEESSAPTTVTVDEVDNADDQFKRGANSVDRYRGDAVQGHTDLFSRRNTRNPGRARSVKGKSTDSKNEEHISHTSQTNTNSDSLTQIWDILDEFLENGITFLRNPTGTDKENPSENMSSNSTEDSSDNSKSAKGRRPASNYLNQFKGFQLFDLRHRDCPQSRNTVFGATKGVVTGHSWRGSNVHTRLTNNHTDSPNTCSWSVPVPSKRHISVAVRLGDEFCRHSFGK